MAVIPRWEWRIFGEHFGDAEQRLASESPERVEESDEVYVLTAESDASVKVRGGLMDVKERIAVDAAGLEQWKPVLKERLPLGEDHVARVFKALDVGRRWTRVELRVVEIHKRRAHHTFMGC